METSKLLPPASDVNQIWNLGLAGTAFVQYLRWADDLNIFRILSDKKAATLDDIVSMTSLSERGADAFMGVLASLKLVRHDGTRYIPSNELVEYLDKKSEYYVGLSLYGMMKKELPPHLTKNEKVKYWSATSGSLWNKIQYLFSKKQSGRPERLAVQHSRNYPSSVTAVNEGYFDGINHLLDVGGGSGVFAIPLARRNHGMTITLAELPRALKHIRSFLETQGVADRVNLVGFNVYETPWPVPACDGMLFGNFLHFCSDSECEQVLAEAYRILPKGGKIFLHEMLWNDSKDGPLPTALWNFWMISVSAGRQRTREEFETMLTKVGFDDIDVAETSGSFSLITCKK
jgi:SAM-dependent methyltransferase